MATTQDLLSAVKQLPTEELEKFTEQFWTWQRQNRKSSAETSSDDEATLLATIEANSRLTDDQQHRFNCLRRKHQTETLTESEAVELQLLWKHVEQMNVARLEALAKLAERRGLDVRALMHELGLTENADVL